MRNIKKTLIGAVITLALIFVIQFVVRCCYEDWDLYIVTSRREREELKGTIDTLYCGTSLCYNTYLPEKLDEALGTNSFNMGSASQPLIGTYYILQDMAEQNPVKRVYLTISLPSLVRSETKTAHYLSAFEYIGSWKWKLAYLMDVGSEDVWTSALFYSTQVEDYFSLKKVKKNLVNKYIKEKEPKNYKGRGYRGSNKVFKGRERVNNSPSNRWSAKKGESQLFEEGYTYLQKIVAFCKENGIELILVMPPFSQDYIEGMGDKEAFQQFLAEKAAEWEIDLYDFTRYTELEEVFTNDKFMDVHHLNNAGAESFCDLLIEIETSEHPEEFFEEIGGSES